MPITLAQHAIDRSSFVVRISFYDEDSAAVVPNSIKWTLLDESTNIINSRSCVAVAAPAATVDIMLSGDDLKYSDGKIRVLAVDAVYDSILATGVPLKDEVRFSIDNLVNTGS